MPSFLGSGGVPRGRGAKSTCPSTLGESVFRSDSWTVEKIAALKKGGISICAAVRLIRD